MSRTFKADRDYGKEFWKSRLHKHGELIGGFAKFRTHKKERAEKRKQEWEFKHVGKKGDYDG